MVVVTHCRNPRTEDVKVIKKGLVGYNLTDEQIEYYYSEFSETHCTGWIPPDKIWISLFSHWLALRTNTGGDIMNVRYVEEIGWVVIKDDDIVYTGTEDSCYQYLEDHTILIVRS